MKIMKDKVYHLIACAVIAFAIASVVANTCVLVFPSCMAGFLGGIACGAGKEYGDSKAKGNAWSWSDMLYDVIGAAIGCLGGLVALLI